MSDEKQNQEKIYLLTVLHSSKAGRVRCWGWSKDLARLEKAILQSTDFLFEMGYYDQAVIEACPEGLAQTSRVVSSYSVDYDPQTKEYSVLKLEGPEWTRGVYNFAMG